MAQATPTNEDESTRLAGTQVVDLFLSIAASSPHYSLEDFVSQQPNIDHREFIVGLAIADWKRQQKQGHSFSPTAYFDQFTHLASHPDAWTVLEVAEPWLIQNEGPRWAEALNEAYPGVAERFIRKQQCNMAPSESEVDLNSLKVGDRILDFEILRFIGEGAFGRVYLANECSLNRECALKVTVDQGSEGQMLAKLDHPGIVQVYREDRLRGKKLLAMQFVDGQSFAQWISETLSDRPRMSIDERIKKAVAFVRDVTIALQHAHVRGVLHRDIKPANILIDEAGKPKLTDFNVATASDNESQFLVGGTVNYMSPEQLRAVCLNDLEAEYAVDIRSDIYSLGVVLLEALSGQKVWGIGKSPNQQAAANQLLAARTRSGPPNIGVHPGVTPSLAAIVDKALSPSPDARYQTAAELETDLSRWLADRRNVHAPNPSHIERVRRHAKQFRNQWIGTAIAMVFVAAVLVYTISNGRRQLAAVTSMTDDISDLVSRGQLTQASELLGEARAKLDQSRVTSLFQPNRHAAAQHSVRDVSNLIATAEAQRFSSRFGEVILRDIHDKQSDQQASLIKDTLETYRVMTSPGWQNEPPFADLAVARQAVIAERITELMLVSMYHSIQESSPSDEQVRMVLDRLPKQHRDLSLFRRFSETRVIDTSTGVPSNRLSTKSAFEAYLRGVLATLQRDHESAAMFYSDSLQTEGGERFWCHYRLAYSCQKLGRYEEAFIHYGACIGYQPTFAWPKFNLGLVCLEIDRPDLCEFYIHQSIHADPEFTAAYVALMAAQIRQEKLDEALATFQAAEQQGISSPELSANYDAAVKKRTSERTSN